MSVHWQDGDRRPAGFTPWDARIARLMGETKPEEIDTYIDKPRSWLAEKLVEADRTAQFNLKAIAELTRSRDELGTDLMRERCRVEELERELEVPHIRIPQGWIDWACLLALAAVGAAGLYLFVQGWARFCVWMAR